MITVYAQYEKREGRIGVTVYHDRECKSHFAHFPWHFDNRPKPEDDKVIVNCYQYDLEWVIPEADPEMAEACRLAMLGTPSIVSSSHLTGANGRFRSALSARRAKA